MQNERLILRPNPNQPLFSEQATQEVGQLIIPRSRSWAEVKNLPASNPEKRAWEMAGVVAWTEGQLPIEGPLSHIWTLNLYERFRREYCTQHGLSLEQMPSWINTDTVTVSDGREVSFLFVSPDTSLPTGDTVTIGSVQDVARLFRERIRVELDRIEQQRVEDQIDILSVEDSLAAEEGEDLDMTIIDHEETWRQNMAECGRNGAVNRDVEALKRWSLLEDTILSGIFEAGSEDEAKHIEFLQRAAGQLKDAALEQGLIIGIVQEAGEQQARTSLYFYPGYEDMTYIGYKENVKLFIENIFGTEEQPE